jgi:ribosomal protein S18 acetylase RimI-like enzyme
MEALRPATDRDEDILWQMLFYASHANEDPGSTVESIRSNPDLRRYVSGWGRVGDLGVVAELDSRAVGAAWLRLFVGDERASPTFIDDRTPELAVAVLPGYEGRGLGTRMLARLLAHADERFPAVTLSVRRDNPALRLYERFGFHQIGIITNRVGGQSYQLLFPLPASGPQPLVSKADHEPGDGSRNTCR